MKKLMIATLCLFCLMSVAYGQSASARAEAREKAASATRDRAEARQERAVRDLNRAAVGTREANHVAGALRQSGVSEGTRAEADRRAAAATANERASVRNAQQAHRDYEAAVAAHEAARSAVNRAKNDEQTEKYSPGVRDYSNSRQRAVPIPVERPQPSRSNAPERPQLRGPVSLERPQLRGSVEPGQPNGGARGTPGVNKGGGRYRF